MRIVLDTNVLVSALLRPGSKPFRVLELCIEGRVGVLLDARILSEYREVLGRPALGIEPGVAAAVLDRLASLAEFVEAAPWESEAPDPADLPFLEVAEAGRADALVTGNLRHYPPAMRRGVRVESPEGFLRMRE